MDQGQQMNKPCQNCGGPFTPRNNNQRHCSVMCQFLSKVENYGTEQCWAWTGAKRGGYGNFRTGGKGVAAHRWSYEHLGNGVLIDGLEVDHLCRNRACVNPAHLEQVTHQENWRRGQQIGAIVRRTGKCPRGHSMDENAYVYGDGKRRACLVCKKAKDAEYRSAHSDKGRAWIRENR